MQTFEFRFAPYSLLLNAGRGQNANEVALRRERRRRLERPLSQLHDVTGHLALLEPLALLHVDVASPPPAPVEVLRDAGGPVNLRDVALARRCALLALLARRLALRAGS